MGGRYFITGSQIGLLRSCVENKCIADALGILHAIEENQFIGNRKNLDRLLMNMDNGNDRMFHDHIKAHFEREHPDWKVVCKICGKTYDEILRDHKKDHKQK